MDGWYNWVPGLMYGIGRWMDGWMDGFVRLPMDGWIDGCMDGW